MGFLKALWRAHPALAILAVILAPILAYFLVGSVLGIAMGFVIHAGIVLVVLCIAIVAFNKLFMRR
jgi:hypothetical protein